MTKSWSIEVGGERYAIEYKAVFVVKVIINGIHARIRVGTYRSCEAWQKGGFK